MQKPPPPLLGFNNNVRHRGKVFHIQTEDSGMKHARITTHLFADGGRIVDSTRTDYSEHLGREDIAPVLRQLMKEQHKAMFVRLRAGDLDERLEAACGPLPLPPPENPPPTAKSLRLSEPVADHLSLPGQQDASTPPLGSPLPNPPSPIIGESRSLTNPNLRRRAPSTMAVGEIELDMRRLSEPPPSASPRLPQVQGSASAAGQATGEQPSSSHAPPSQGPKSNSEEARYAPPRPASIFGDVPPVSKSLFGERLISEQTLDEVILSYLAEDLEGPMD